MIKHLSIPLLLALFAIPTTGSASVAGGSFGVEMYYSPPFTDAFGDYMAITGQTDGDVEATGEGVSNGDQVYYFPASKAGHRGIATVRRGSEALATPPEVKFLQLPDGPELRLLTRAGNELFLGTDSELIRAVANDEPTTATIEALSDIGTLRGLHVEAGTGRILRMGSRLECYDPSPSGYVLRGEADIRGDGMAVDGLSGTIVVLNGARVETYRWPEGATAPEEGKGFVHPYPGRGVRGYICAGPQGIVYACRENGTPYSPYQYEPFDYSTEVYAYRVRPFPQAPEMVESYGISSTGADEIPGPMVAGPEGLWVGGRIDSVTPSVRSLYGKFDADGTLAIRAGYGIASIFSATHVAFGTPAGLLGAGLAGTGQKGLFRQISWAPTHPEKFLHGIRFSADQAGILTSIGYQALKAGGGVRLAVYAAETSEAGTAMVRVAEVESTTSVSGRNVATIPSPRPFIPYGTPCTVVAQCDDPDLLAFGTEFPIAGFIIADSPFPDRYAPSAELPHRGTPALAVYYDRIVRLPSVTARNWRSDGAYPLPWVTADGNLAITIAYGAVYDEIEISSSPDFSGTIDRPKVPLPFDGKFIYKLRNVTSGRQTLYFRATALTPQVSAPLALEVKVDPDPPSVPGVPYCSNCGDSFDGYPVFAWSPSTDGDGVGVMRYDYEVKGLYSYSGETETNTDLAPTVIPPQLVRVRVRSVDLLGNISAWSEYSTDIWGPSAVPPQLTSVATESLYQNSPQVRFDYTRASMNPETIEMSEDPAFAVVQSETWYESATHSSVFTLEDRQGLHTTYHRLTGELGTSAVLQKEVFLDSVAPVAEAPVAASAFGANGSMDVVWRLPVDPEPASGAAAANLRIAGGTNPLIDWDFPLNPDSPTTQTITLSYGHAGGEFRAFLAGTDRATNRGTEAASQPFVINAKPLRPEAALISPEQPTSSEEVAASATGATDPDGDAIVGYHYSFVRLSPEPAVTVHGSILSPDRTARGERWHAIASALDDRGAVGFPLESAEFTIGNSAPTQPFVAIVPRAPEPGDSLAVEVLRGATDADGDAIAYDYRWSESDDGGNTWTTQTDLDGSPQVDGPRIEPGALWKVEYIPYEEHTVQAGRVEGQAGWDMVRIGTDEQPPELTPTSQPRAVQRSNGTTHIRATWAASDPDGGQVLVDVYLTNLTTMGLTLVASRVTGTGFEFDYDLPPTGGPYYLHLVARDGTGAVTQVTSSPIVTVEPGSGQGWMLE